MPHIRTFATLVGILSAGLLAGCSDAGPKRFAVSGTVKYKDAPIPIGTVTFLAEDTGAVAGGATIKDGAYEIPAAGGLPAGRYKVSVSYPDPKGAVPAPKEGEAPGPGPSKEVKELLPSKYNRDTELRAEVKADGANTFPFDLK